MLEYWNRHDVNGVLDFYDEGIVWTNIALEEEYRGTAQVGAFIEKLLIAFPDLHFAVSERIAHENQVAEKWEIRGTHGAVSQHPGNRSTGAHPRYEYGRDAHRQVLPRSLLLRLNGRAAPNRPDAVNRGNPDVAGPRAPRAAVNRLPVATMAGLHLFLQGYRFIGFDERVMIRFAQERAVLRRQGLLIADFDLLIAATALVHQLTLVTRNTQHFERIRGLQLYL